MRNLLLLGLVCLVLGGCAEPAGTAKAKAGRTLVGRWEVSGENVPLEQTFSDDGQFESESVNELPSVDGKKVEAVIVMSGSYKYDGKKLYTTVGSIDVRGVPDDLRENLVHNSRENLGKSHSAVLEWKSDDKIIARQPKGKILMYVRVSGSGS